MQLFRDPHFLASSLGHFMVDTLNGARGVLFTYINVALGMTNVVLGLVTTLYLVSAALVQPFCGWIADRYGTRWVAAGGILWMGGFFSLAMLTPGTLSQILLVIASLGSGAFHPAGAVEAALSGRENMAGKETISSSYFFSAGQFGFFVGPLAAGALLARWGMPGMLALSVFAIPIGVYASIVLKPIKHAGDVQDSQTSLSRDFRPARPEFRWMPFLVLAMVAGFQSWAQANISTFLPKYLSDLGYSVTYYGLAIAFFTGGTVVGNLFGGHMADRYGKSPVILWGLCLGSIPTFALAWLGNSYWLFPAVFLSGALTGMVFSSIIVIAQRMTPGGAALASGLVLGFMFASGALGILVSGIVADQMGFEQVFFLSAGLALTGGLISLGLKESHTKVVYEPVR